MLIFSRQHVDRTVVLNDQNCYWQSVRSEDMVHRAALLTEEIVFEATSVLSVEFPCFVCDQGLFAGSVVLQHSEHRIFASKNRACRMSLGLCVSGWHLGSGCAPGGALVRTC